MERIPVKIIEFTKGEVEIPESVRLQANLELVDKWLEGSLVTEQVQCIGW